MFKVILASMVFGGVIALTGTTRGQMVIADLRFEDMLEANLTDKDMDFENIVEIHLTNPEIKGADLSGNPNFSNQIGTYLTNPEIKGADLSGNLNFSNPIGNPSGAYPPEPATIALLALGGLLMLRRQNRA